ncbi:MAG: RES family NAD+ phosphorylase [Nitrolancea sp.]
MSESVSGQIAAHALQSVGAPPGPIYRITRLDTDPFEPAPWEYCGSNRFDDPQQEFRVIYCASERSAAFGETLARYRRSLSLLALLQEVDDDEESLEDALRGLLDPSDERCGVVPADWRFKRQIGTTVLDSTLRFAAISEPESVAYLRTVLAPAATMLSLADVDLGTIFSSNRGITQQCARHIYELHNEHGTPLFAGICYPSRINQYWTCWAIFHDRMSHTPGIAETTIDPHDPGFLDAARLLDLSIEAVRGQGTFIRP